MSASQQSTWQLSDFDVPPQDGKTRFHDFPLHKDLMHAIADLGFQYCTPIQAQVLGHTLNEEDAIGKAQTGTGKTAAFLITLINDMLQHPLEHKRYAAEPRALVIAPTRELVMQIEKDAKQLIKHTDLNVMSVVGGMDFERQLKKLNNQLTDILVATPGRLLDFLRRKQVWLDRVESLVIDEADRMLDMGFIPDVKRIIYATPRSEYRQTLLFSATFDRNVMNLARRWTVNPQIVEIEPDNVVTDQVDQRVYLTETSKKFNLLCHFIRQEKLKKVIVFANMRVTTRKLRDRLSKQGVKVAMLSGEVPQNKRVKTLERFRSGNIDVLVATDVAGRGIHVDDISHVINYNLPEDPEDYVHRVGRTGRAGKTGVSISFATEDEAFILPDLEKAIGQKLECQFPPEEFTEEAAQ